MTYPSVKGRRVLVFGGRGVLGSQIVAEFAAAGALVIAADSVPGFAMHDVTADLADTASVEAAVASAGEKLGGHVEVLVNAAGILSEIDAVDIGDDEWERMLDINLTGVMRATRAVLPAMLDAGWGRVITIASNLGTKGGAQMAHYSAAKAGVIGYTRALAREVSAAGVLVNCISPGPFHTPMFEKVSPEWKAEKLRELPLGRFGFAAEISPTALLLASEPGGNLYVGQNLGPNSGDIML